MTNNFDNKNPSLIEKLPPQNIDAEKSLLGSLLIDKNAIVKVADFLQVKDFYKVNHKKIYEGILELFEKGEPIDFLTVSTRLKEKKMLAAIGGNSYLTELANFVPTASHISNYAKIVQRKRILRNLIEASQEINSIGYNEEEDIEVLLDQAEQRIFSIAQRSLTQNFVPVKAGLEEAFERIDMLSKHKDAPRGLATGFTDLDNLLTGLQKSDLIILAARPSLGKSALAVNLATDIAISQNIPVGIFSLEMSKDQIIDRLIASLSNIDLWKLRTGRLSAQGEDNDFTKIQHAMGILSEAPIYIDDSASSNVLQMRAMTRRLQAEHGLGLIVIDYLQLMEPRNPMASIVQQVTEISRSLKGLARELNVPVLALSQLSRAVEQRSPQIPRLSDLRESGCLAGDTLLTRADTGEKIPIKDLVGQTNIPIHSLDENLKIKEMKISKVFSSGKKMVYELETRSGLKIKASANHPFWKISGWTRLSELNIGDKIATPKKPNNIKPNTNLDVWPKETWQFIINPIRQNLDMSWREFSAGIKTKYCGTTLFKHGIGAERLDRIATLLNSPEIKNMTKSDIFWDEIISIKALDVQEVYDATVPGLHNFIANDIIVENSLEQDADVVLFIHREERYRPETTKKNIADIIVAKHRNGPIGSVELYFDDQRVSFRNLAKGERPEETEDSHQEF
ncbi:MAG: replicative DNA helicase [Patescibacteria group bacterium]|nr:replicative DNA helicase [Patescibacteria group bacterium]